MHLVEIELLRHLVEAMDSYSLMHEWDGNHWIATKPGEVSTVWLNKTSKLLFPCQYCELSKHHVNSVKTKLVPNSSTTLHFWAPCHVPGSLSSWDSWAIKPFHHWRKPSFPSSTIGLFPIGTWYEWFSQSLNWDSIWDLWGNIWCQKTPFVSTEGMWTLREQVASAKGRYGIPLRMAFLHSRFEQRFT